MCGSVSPPSCNAAVDGEEANNFLNVLEEHPTIVATSGIKPIKRLGLSSRHFVKLYILHSLSAWGDNIWNFAIGLFLVKLYPQDLLVTALYGLVSNGAVLFFGGPLGTALDRTERRKAAIACLVVQNVSVTLCCFTIILPFWIPSLQTESETTAYIFVVMTIILGAISFLASSGYKLVMERDWIVIIAAGNQKTLARLNSVLRTIDLTTFVLAPSLVGLLMSATSVPATALFLAAWNIISVFAEYYLLNWICRSIPSLDTPKPIHEGSWFLNSCEGWGLYFQHPVLPAALGLASLFMTVLGFDNITHGYAISVGVKPWILGATTAASSVFGILGALCFPVLLMHYSLETTGFLGFSSFVLIYIPVVISVFLPGSPFDPHALWSTTGVPTNATELGSFTAVTNATQADVYIKGCESRLSIGFFLGGLVLGRFSLWLSDLSVALILQERVEEANRGSINGIQQSVQTAMDCMKFALVAFIPGVESFGYLVFSSYAFTVLGCILFSIYARNVFRTRHQRSEVSSVNQMTKEAIEHGLTLDGDPLTAKLNSAA